jgi:hypothetical protein
MEKKKMLVRTNPRMIMPEEFGQQQAPKLAVSSKTSAVQPTGPMPVRSLHQFMAGLQFDQITHFRREKYQPWPVWAADPECDSFTVTKGTALVLTCVRYRVLSSYSMVTNGVPWGKVAYYLQDEGLMPFYLMNPPPLRAIRTTINGSTIASQQFIYVDPAPFVPPALPATIVDGYYTLNQNIIPPGYSMQTIATEDQVIKTFIFDPVGLLNAIADKLEWFGVEYYGFTMPLTAWNRYKQDFAP